MASILSNVRERARQIFSAADQEDEFIYFWDDFEEEEEYIEEVSFSISDNIRRNSVFLLHALVFFLSGGLITILVLFDPSVLVLIISALLLPSIVISYLIVRSGYIGIIRILEDNIKEIEKGNFHGTDELLYMKFQNPSLEKFDQFRQNMIGTLRKLERNANLVQSEIDFHTSQLASIHSRLDEINLSLENTAASAAVYQETRSYLGEVSHGIDEFTLSFDTALNGIDEITSLLKSIGKQTSMLALNAGIEAAKAGGRGKGFEVVSANLRRLAQHATESSTRTKIMAKEISESAKEALKAITDGITNLEHQLNNTQDQIIAYNTDLYSVIRELDAAQSNANTAINLLEEGKEEMSVYRF